MKIIYEDGENACFFGAPFTVEPLELATTIGLQKAGTMVSVGQSSKAVKVYSCLGMMVVQW